MDGFQRGHFLVGFGGQLLEALDLAVQSLLARQAAHGIVVVIVGGLEGVAELVEPLRHQAHLVVYLPCPAADLPRLVVALFYHPQVGDGAQYGHQGCVGDHDHAFLVAVIEQVLVVLHRLYVGRLYGHEHQHKIGAADAGQVDVVLGGEVVDVLAHCQGVGVQRQFALFIGVGADSAVVIHQRDFAVDDQVLAVRQLDDEVGEFAPALIVLEAGLGVVVFARLQPRQFQGALQLGLPPVAGGFLVALQGRGQVGGLAVHLQPHLQHFLDFLLQGGVAPH